MNLLVLRLSSLGDVLHTLPAISDLAMQRPDLQLDWLVEPAFAPIVAWHPGVHQAVPFSLRALKKKTTGYAAGPFLVTQGATDQPL